MIATILAAALVTSLVWVLICRRITKQRDEALAELHKAARLTDSLSGLVDIWRSTESGGGGSSDAY